MNINRPVAGPPSSQVRILKVLAWKDHPALGGPGNLVPRGKPATPTRNRSFAQLCSCAGREIAPLEVELRQPYDIWLL